MLKRVLVLAFSLGLLPLFAACGDHNSSGAGGADPNACASGVAECPAGSFIMCGGMESLVPCCVGGEKGQACATDAGVSTHACPATCATCGDGLPLCAVDLATRAVTCLCNP